MPDRIEKTIELKAPVDRVWRALTDAKEFGTWFRVALDTPFVEGERAHGHVTYEGYEHLRFEVKVVAMDRPRRFAFTWHPYAVDPAVDYASESPTTVEFLLEQTQTGTRLTMTEKGFEGLPAHRRDEAMRMNDSGWSTQIENIRAHVGG
jgi:uncharacterized protein YndB with AHSA1/START domain